LDLACGGGRHSRLLASIGHAVLALDRDADLLNRLVDQRITTMLFDLETAAPCGEPVWPFSANRFTGIVVTNYLHRPLFPFIAASLTPNGILIYETFAQGNEHFGKPSNPNFLLVKDELLKFAADNSLQIIAYENGYIDSPKPALIQRICAVKSSTDLSVIRLRLT
jgi:SAM-dependent methyltransferase